jgi:hypothetical protein
MKVGDASSFAVDAKDRVWLLHRPRTIKPEEGKKAAPAVVVFDAAGAVVKTWGGDGAGYEWPQREHGIHVDHKGFIWIGGNYCPADAQAANRASDDQLLKFTEDGKFVLQIGRSSQSKGNADRQNLHRPADQWVNPRTNELFVADGYGNHRIAVFDADNGQFKRMWGAFGRAPIDDDHCTLAPAQPVTGDGPGQFSIVHAVRVANDGTVYVADRENRRVQMFSSDGKFLKQVVKADTTFARDLALLTRPGAAVPLRRQRRRHSSRRPQDARDRRRHQGAWPDRRRPPSGHRLEGESLHRPDRRGHAEAHLQGDVEVGRGERQAKLAASCGLPLPL